MNNIDIKQAAQIAVQYKDGAAITGAEFDDRLFVFHFAGDDPFVNRPVAVDRQTGAAQTLGATEYARLSGSLQEVR